jgi:hypothetical protein
VRGAIEYIVVCLVCLVSVACSLPGNATFDSSHLLAGEAERRLAVQIQIALTMHVADHALATAEGEYSDCECCSSCSLLRPCMSLVPDCDCETQRLLHCSPDAGIISLPYDHPLRPTRQYHSPCIVYYCL